MPATTTYLPSAKRARVMTMNIGALILRHKDELAGHADKLAELEVVAIRHGNWHVDHWQAIKPLAEVIDRGFFGRLSWLLRGK